MPNDNGLPLVSQNDCNPVPVFHCHVLLKRIDATGRLTARLANLDGITAEGTSERDLLTSLTRQFKAAMQEYHQAKKPIPWIEPARTPEDGEFERFIPVHL